MSVKGAAIRTAIFLTIGALAGTLLYTTLSRERFGVDTRAYTAVFTDVSALEKGDEVRVAGVRVGQVTGLTLQADNTMAVKFAVRSSQPVTQTTQAAVRYANLIGDRYLELTAGDSRTQGLPPDSTIPNARTSPAVDLDMLLGGFKPLFRGLQPKQVNKLASDIVATLQGNGGTIRSLLTHTASLTNTLADRDHVIGQLIDRLNKVLETLGSRDEQVATMVSNLQQLVSGLASDRDRIGSALEQVDSLSSKVSGLLAEVRRPLKGTLDQIHRIATTLDENKNAVNKALDDIPEAHKRLHRISSYGTFFNMYLCSIQIKVTDSDGQPMTLPVLGSNSNTPRCQP